IRMLLEERETDPNHLDQDGDSPLQFAAILGLVRIVSLLVSNGANVNAVNGRRFSSLHLAVQMNRIPVVRLLLFKGADLYGVTDSGHTV
ncbi:ankyrin repeat-containing domain protein, partial [Baffinella frigidus]